MTRATSIARRPSLLLFPLLFILAVASALGGCARGRMLADVEGLDGLRASADRVNALGRRVRAESLAWDVTKRSIRGRAWMVAGREQRERLLRLTPGPSFPDGAEPLLEALLAEGHRVLLTGAWGLAGDWDDPTVDLDLLARAERAALASLTTTEAQARWLAQLTAALPPVEPHPGAVIRAASLFPVTPFLYAWVWNHVLHEWRGPNWRDFASVRTFVPDRSQDADILAHLGTATDEELLRLFAPIVIQEAGGDGVLDPRLDVPGRAMLLPGADGTPLSRVDAAQPTIYGDVTHALLGGSWHKQLNYSLWYPAHAEREPGDPEAGAVEGELVRITLDDARVPMLAEAVYACGCYHRIYPGEGLERAARDAWGAPIVDDSALAAPVPWKIDAIIPEPAGTFDPADPHPRVFVRSGFHLIALVSFDAPVPPSPARESLVLRRTDELDRLPYGPRLASFFGRDGLVRGADRPEASLLYATGIYHAGTPRTRGARKIHFDQYDYDDPALLARLLRLPPRPVPDLAGLGGAPLPLAAAGDGGVRREP